MLSTPRLHRCTAPWLAALACAGVQAQGVRPEAPAGSVEPAVQRSVTEDDAVRIEELRVRGQTQRIVVRLKNGARDYEVLPGGGGRDPSQALGASAGAAGKRVWQVLSF